MKELAKQYDPSQVEDRIYQFWLDGGYFHAEPDSKKKPYTIVMPPPNVTGQLHMGHAMDNTMQDILIRYKRMQGYAALWVPGTDHASIATEAKVVEAMRKEGLTKEMVGREGFLDPRLGLEEQIRQPHRQPAEKARLQLRLGPRALHDGRGLLRRREGSVRAAV
jgi:valyl-tRNA synthetase